MLHSVRINSDNEDRLLLIGRHTYTQQAVRFLGERGEEVFAAEGVSGLS